MCIRLKFYFAAMHEVIIRKGKWSKRRKTKTSTNQNVDKPKRRQTETSTNQNLDKPKRRQTETSTLHLSTLYAHIFIYLSAIVYLTAILNNDGW